jgi:hypothetical protein
MDRNPSPNSTSLKEIPGGEIAPQHSKTKSMTVIYAAFEAFTRHFSKNHKNTIINIKQCKLNIMKERYNYKNWGA